MSYAIIRNEKYKRENLKGIYRHNERRNKNYSNKNINQELSHLNYSLKDCKHSYEKEFELIREKYNLKGQIKTVSNIVCEYIITSDKEFFNSIGAEETMWALASVPLLWWRMCGLPTKGIWKHI